MKRIREDSRNGEGEFRTAARLLRDVPPIDRDPNRQRRVRLRLHTSSKPSLAAHFWQPVAIAILLLAGVAGARGGAPAGWRSAGERITAWLYRPVVSTAPAAAPAAKLQPSASPSQTPSAPPAVSAITPEAGAEPSFAEQALPAATTKPTIHRSASAAAAAPTAAAGAPRVATAEQRAASPIAEGPGAELVVAALQARRVGNVARAEQLLDEYRARYPRGALEEETLILSLEAAVLRKSARAPELARGYLARFPQGQYRKWVLQTLQEPRH